MSKENGTATMSRWKGRSGQVVKGVFRAQIGEKGCKAVKHLPEAVYERLPWTSQLIASRCVELDVAAASFDLFDCERAVLALACQLSEMSGAPAASSREAFVSFGGEGVLLRILFCSFESHQEGENASIRMNRVWTLRKDCLDILRELCSTVPFFAESLAARRDFVLKCFSLMENKAAFDSAVLLVEEMLAVTDEIFDLREHPKLADLVHNFSAGQLLLFCRILAMVVFEPEAPKVVAGLEPFIAGEVEKRSAIADSNHEIILSIPGILSRLLKLLYHDKRPPSLRGTPSTALLRRYIGNNNDGEDISFARTLLTASRLLDAAELGFTVEADGAVDIMSLMTLTPSDFLAPASQVEILFVLCALCGSMKRDEVQNTLAELGLVDILAHMFGQLDWSVSLDIGKSAGIHGHGCACNPPVALKIQYLRLIHNFCDRDSCNRKNKHLLYKSVTNLHKGNNTASELPKGADGLILKIVNVFIREPADSMFRFWLASCVESFLRGSDLDDQETLASTGLMEHLLTEILKGGFSSASSLQINFDLLGELIKFNRVLFTKLSRLLDGDKFDRFIEVLVTNLVDSNVFIRSVLLSLETFRQSRQTPLESDNEMRSIKGRPGRHHRWRDDDECPIELFIMHNESRLLRDLMSAVPLCDVNQDNICVINTALIMFILAERNGILPQAYLQALKGVESSERTRDHILRKFRHLLKFWQRYYFRKYGRDSASLQYSTSIPFEDWLRVVNLLCVEAQPSPRLDNLPDFESDRSGISTSSESSSSRRT